MHNLITDFDLVCESKFHIGLIGSMYFFGEAVGSLVYTAFATYLSSTRVRHIITKNIVLMCVLYALTLWLRNLFSLYVCIFIVGLT